MYLDFSTYSASSMTLEDLQYSASSMTLADLQYLCVLANKGTYRQAFEVVRFGIER